MLERLFKYIVKSITIILSLIGLRYVLAYFGVRIPIEWVGIFFAGSLGLYGVFLILIVAILINIL